MRARSSPPSAQPTAVAPDGIAIHTFDLTTGDFVGVAEGRIPPGRYGVHRHLSLEQYTYVVSGTVTAITHSGEHPVERAVTLTRGELLLTLPVESLQFVNEGPGEARVLFICAPPYPADDADTRTLDTHGPPAADEMAAAITRMEAVRASFNAAIDRRLASLRADAARSDQRG